MCALACLVASLFSLSSPSPSMPHPRHSLSCLHQTSSFTLQLPNSPHFTLAHSLSGGVSLSFPSILPSTIPPSISSPIPSIPSSSSVRISVELLPAHPESSRVELKPSVSLPFPARIGLSPSTPPYHQTSTTCVSAPQRILARATRPWRFPFSDCLDFAQRSEPPTTTAV